MPFGQYYLQADIFDPASKQRQVDHLLLQSLPKFFNVIIQTDKELYKAKDLIRFRLFAFDADTRPVNIEGTTMVSIIDPHGFIMQRTTNFTFTKGRYSDEMQLSTLITNGLWTIRAHVNELVSRLREIFFYYSKFTGYRENCYSRHIRVAYDHR